MIGSWKGYFEARYSKDTSGNHVWRIHCLQDGCLHNFSSTATSSTLSSHFRARHLEELHKIKQKASATGNSTVGSSPTSLVQTKLDGTSIPIPKEGKIVSAALEWIIADLQPFSAIDTPKHKALLNLYNPRLSVPCSATVRNALPDHRRGLTDILKKLMNESMLFGAITADSWTSQSNKPFMGITLSWLDSNFNNYECVLDLAPQPYPHDASNTARLIRK